MGRARITLVVLALALVTGLPSAGTAEPCVDLEPFAGFPEVDLTVSSYTSLDDPPVEYVMYRGTVPSFDGLPMSVDVTIPCSAVGPVPLVTMAHGWTDDKTIWEETGRSNTVSSTFRRASNHHWNNIWFASRGYAVLNYTARGWKDSCGPTAAGSIPLVAPGQRCLDHRYWIHMSDQRWEVRDTAWLTAGLVESGIADPDALAITGGSYGGGTTIMNAMLGNRIVCGAGAALAPDPCEGKADGEYVPWTTRAGEPLRWRVAVPMYTWGDVIQVLLPNGRGSDGVLLPDRDHHDPIGIPIQSYLAGLYAAGQPLGNGFYQPPGIDVRSDITTLTARTLAGNPFSMADPLVATGITQFVTYKSAIKIEPAITVPIFWTQGFTDPLFTAFEPLQIADRLRAFDPDYPISLFFGDLGHDYAAERVDEWDAAHEQMNAFLDHYLTGAGSVPPTQVTAAITRCLDDGAPMELVTVPSWGELHTSVTRFEVEGGGVSSSAMMTEAGRATDPVTTATDPIPGAYKKCRIMRPATDESNTVTYRFPVAEPLTLLGGPVVEVGYATTAPDTEINVRLWDVAPDGSAQGLITRGTFRSLEGPGVGLRARFQIAPTGYRFEAGHTIKLEITANDAPYRQQSNVPALLRVTDVGLELPVR